MARQRYLTNFSKKPYEVGALVVKDGTRNFMSRSTLAILLLSLTGVIGLFLLESHVGLTLWDEGFLWYGVQRVMSGEVPMRDFTSYDIGRYYWSAAFMGLLGSKGIVALRIAIAAFEAIALFLGLTALARSYPIRNLLFWLLAVITLLIWMAPQYRVFDIALPIILVSALSFLVEKPTPCRYFLTGLVIGIVAVFGRNHGVYGVVGSLGVIAYLATKREGGTKLRTAFICWLSGIFVGYLPMVIFIVVVPGFAQAFWESIRNLSEMKGTNIPLPVPWPWLLPFKQLSIVETMRGMMFRMSFIFIVGFGLSGIIWAMRKKLKGETVPAALVASIFLTLPYAHHAYSRADITHLAPGILPFVMGILALLAAQAANIKRSLFLLLLFVGASLLLMLPVRYIWECAAINKCVDANILGDKLKIDQGVANNLAILAVLSEQYAPDDRMILVAPFWPGVYAALNKKSPILEIYAISPRNAAFQHAEIERIKAADPGLVVINDFAFDGRDDLRYSNTHPIIDQYVRDNFAKLSSDNSEIRIYKAK